MLNLYASNYAEGKQKDGQRTSKVSFESFHQRNPSDSQYNDDSNNCEVILENVLYTDSD